VTPAESLPNVHFIPKVATSRFGAIYREARGLAHLVTASMSMDKDALTAALRWDRTQHSPVVSGCTLCSGGGLPWRHDGTPGSSIELEQEERRAVNKRTILLATGILALAAACPRSLAQGAGGVAPTVSAGTKVGVVNVGTVFAKYEKANIFKDELQRTIKPFKDKADKWRKEMIEYQDLIQKGDFKTYKKEDLEKAVLDRKRAMEDMDREVRNLIGKQQEEQLVQLWKEVTAHIRGYGASKGFHMVLGYGDPLKAEELDTFPNINRKMQGMDLGGVCPLFVGPGLDISEDVVLSLNSAYRQNRPAGSPVSAVPGAIPPKGSN
jgi:Skp family chaperone for outer membrane proteins